MNTYTAQATATRKRRAPQYAAARELHKALKLYSQDIRTARENGTKMPSLRDYTVRVGMHTVATEWAKGRFGELK